VSVILAYTSTVHSFSSPHLTRSSENDEWNETRRRIERERRGVEVTRVKRQMDGTNSDFGKPKTTHHEIQGMLGSVLSFSDAKTAFNT
jgi:hypothetical protein